MKRETIGNILNFLNTKEGKEVPDKWKLIKELETYPDDLQYKVKGDLNLRGLPIMKLPNDLYVEGDILASFCFGLTELPNKLYVERNLYINYTNIINLPKYLYVGGNMSVWDTPLVKKYTEDEISEAIKLGGGRVRGKIFV